jgi:hypothetical protein
VIYGRYLISPQFLPLNRHDISPPSPGIGEAFEVRSSKSVAVSRWRYGYGHGGMVDEWPGTDSKPTKSQLVAGSATAGPVVAAVYMFTHNTGVRLLPNAQQPE